MLVIFDCDGVLVDSEILAAKVFSWQLAKEHISLDYLSCYTAFKGHTLGYCLEWLNVNFPKKLTPGFLSRLEQATQKAFSEQLRPVEGIQEVLEYLQQVNILFCVASNGGHAKIRNSLQATGLIKYFPDSIFSVEDVERGKPAPDLYTHAAEVMGVPAKFCVVVEDSFTGLEAAARAKMRALFYSNRRLPSTRLSGETAQADWYKRRLPFNSMQQIGVHLKGLCGN